MKKLLPIIAIFVALSIGWNQIDQPNDFASLTDQNDPVFANAFKEGKSGIQAEGNGIVIKILADDNDGSRHQRFILRLDSGQTLLISHNIDLAPRLSSLKKGDAVASMEYSSGTQKETSFIGRIMTHMAVMCQVGCSTMAKLTSSHPARRYSIRKKPRYYKETPQL